MRISDWSSDVCSSDLGRSRPPAAASDRPARVRARSACRPPGPARGEAAAASCSCQKLHAGEDCQRVAVPDGVAQRSEEHTSELQSLMRTSYAVFCLKKKKDTTYTTQYTTSMITSCMRDTLHCTVST